MISKYNYAVMKIGILREGLPGVSSWHKII
jgi:hypothetical protein